jgi:hypothetical protein
VKAGGGATGGNGWSNGLNAIDVKGGYGGGLNRGFKAGES